MHFRHSPLHLPKEGKVDGMEDEGKKKCDIEAVSQQLSLKKKMEEGDIEKSDSF